MFARLGARVIQADVIAHELMQPGEGVYEEVVRRFGAGVLNADGTISRPKLAEAAFRSTESPRAVEDLNRIVHPAVIRKQEQWMEEVGRREPNAVTMVEAALIFEAGIARRFDRLVVVTCRPEQRVARWAQRLNIAEDVARSEVTRRMAAQWPDEEKIGSADFLIDNSGSLDETERRVRAVYSKLSEEAVNRPTRTGPVLAPDENEKTEN
jgi:dephospho-CoA kinase